MPEVLKEQEAGTVFALDIGTRSIIGMLGHGENGRFCVTAIEKEEHGRRAMLDGQIVEIEQVSAVAREVVRRLEEKTGIRLRRVCVAAAGRALKSKSAGFQLSFDELRRADEDVIGQLEAGAVSEAEKLVAAESAGQGRFYMVGYTARQYVVDGYPMANLLDHRGQVFQADVVATFLPSGVVESLYAVMGRLGLEVSSLTLEPIAALNAAIPGDIRLLNLVLVDIGAGTSDIAVCREGSVVGYTMATVAGDEVTELLMRSLLVDFKTAERLKMGLGSVEPIQYPDILGIKHEITSDNLAELLQPAAQRLAKEIAASVLELNGGVPSAVFLAGGGSKLLGLPQMVAAELEMSEARVALAGNHFGDSAFSEEYDLNDPEYATPLGIGTSAALGMINDSYMITLNGLPAKLFRNGTLNLRDVLLMNGFHYADMMGRTGANLSFTLNGRREFFRGMPGVESRMMINGEEAQLSTVVQAGDRIDFTPARPGVSASQTLAQLLGEDFSGLVTVNGEAMELSYSIRQGDAVETAGGEIPRRDSPGASQPQPTIKAEALAGGTTEKRGPRPLSEGKGRPVPATEPVKEASAAPKEAASVKEKDATEKTLPPPVKAVEENTERPAGPQASPGKVEEARLAEEKTPREKPLPLVEAAPEKAVKSAPLAEKPAAALQEKKAINPKPLAPARPVEEPAGQLSFDRGLLVVLNGKPLHLPPKTQGGDYFLMDVLEYSGLDFSRLERPVDLKVNGVEGQFSQMLHRNDQITIKYRD